jgi:general secretion pathway protein A
MYAPFFGLSKEPFSIAPDPRFLFMSDQHREALAHLLYGVSGGGGFVLLTGEIGAGKTTVCRAFLEQVPPRCAVAYIFNPKLSVVELLQTICEEFGVELPKPAAPGLVLSAKDHVDALNRYLLAAHAAGGHTVLIIDEAQSLAADVLEQLRLLTNLETAEKKLLQIVLIGQPELREMLARPDLEQLAQRVIARYHLPALSVQETGQYIQHRLAVASPGGLGVAVREPFDARAVSRIHTLSRGVPRRINLLCDRALLGAYAHGQQRVTPAMVDQAAREVFGDEGQARTPGLPARQRHGPARRWSTAAAVAGGAGGALVLAGAAFWWWQGPHGGGGSARTPALVASSPAAGPTAAGPSAAVASASPIATPSPPVAGAVDERGTAGPLHEATARAPTPGQALALINDPAAVLAGAWREESAALRELASAWQHSLPEGNACDLAQAVGLVCHRAGSGLAVLRQLDRPAMLVLREETTLLPAGPGGQPAYVLLLGVGPTGATLAAGGQQWRLALPALGRVWRGEFATFWRSPAGWRAGVDPVEDPALQTWLLQRLGESGGLVAGVPLREQVRNFQVVNGLQADGRAGPLTLMLLGHAGEPRLLQER